MSPLGDTGGSYSQLIITCEAECNIAKGDPVTHLENYKVRNYLGDLFGQAMHDAKKGQSLPVCVRGIVRFRRENFNSFGNYAPRAWRISENGPVLVPMVMGDVLQVMFLSDGRLDILL